ncbi:hypothetical protein ACHWQZ_G007020 [Mnemiopsis leidyi]
MNSFNDHGMYIQNILSFKAAVSDSESWPEEVKIGHVVVSFLNTTNGSHLKYIMETLRRYPKIVAIVGFSASSDDVIESASFLTAIRMPTFSLSSSINIDELLKKKKKKKNHEYMIPITSVRSVQMGDTIPSILDELGANIVSIFYEVGKELEFSKLSQELSGSRNYTKVDVLGYRVLPKSSSEDASNIVLDYITKNIDEASSQVGGNRIHTVVFLIYGKTLDEIILNMALHKEKLPNLVFVTDSSGCRSSTEFQNAVGKLSLNDVSMFRICQSLYSAPKVIEYTQNYDLYIRKDGEMMPTSQIINHWYRKVEGLQPCITQEDTNCKSVSELCFKDGKQSRYNHRIYYTVKKILKSLKDITEEQLKIVSERTFEDILFETSEIGKIIYDGFRNNNIDLPEGTSFLRYTNKQMENDYEVIFDGKGKFDKSATLWTSSKNNTRFKDFMMAAKSDIVSRPDQHFACSLDCHKSTKKVLHSKFLNCWTCVPCVGNTFTSNGSSSLCQSCNSDRTFLWVNDDKTACDRPAGSVNFATISGKVVWVLASVNIVILIVTIVIYARYWRSKVIISSGRELCCVMFSGILLGHVESLLIAVEPNLPICTAVQILSHIFIMLTACPLLVKTFRIWMVFKFSVKMGKGIKKYVNNWVTLAQCVILMLPQLLFLLIDLFLNDSYNFKFIVNYTEESLEVPIVVTKSCGPGDFTLMLASIVYTGFILLVASVLGWDCRKLPDNFKARNQLVFELK